MHRLEKLKESIKSRARLTALSFLFLMGTTFVSCFCLYLPNWLWPHKYTAFNLGSTIAGSFMGQVTLLVAMSIISVLFKKEDDPEDIPARLKDVRDLPDIEGP